MLSSSFETASDAVDSLQNAHREGEGAAHSGLDGEQDPGATSSGPLGFKFITFTKPDEHRDKTTRRYIRSHAMREYHQRRQLAGKQRPSSSRALLPRHSSPVSYLAAGPDDPFSTLPLDLSEMDRFFLHRFHQFAFDIDSTNVFLNSTTIRNEYLPVAIMDPILLNGMLCAGAQCLEWSGSEYAAGARGQYSLMYKGRMIRLLKQALAGGSGTISDELVAGVFALASFECVDGHQDEYHLHAKALHRLVELRGGLETLGMNGFLKTSIYNIDKTAAALFGTDPYHMTSVAQNPVVSIGSLNSGFLPMPILSNLSEELISILDEICALSSDADRMTGTINWTSGVPCFRRLESFMAQSKSIDPLLALPDIEESTSIAVYLFFIRICTNIPNHSWPGSLRARTVFEAINRLLVWDAHDEFLGLMLWWAFLGSLAPKPPESTRKWTELIANIANEMGVSTWEQAKSILKTFLWLEPTSEVTGRETWLQAQALHVNFDQTYLVHH